MKGSLKEIRIKNGLYPSFVSEKLGISLRHFSRIESGQGYLTYERMIILSKLYNITTDNIKEAFERSN